MNRIAVLVENRLNLISNKYTIGFLTISSHIIKNKGKVNYREKRNKSHMQKLVRIFPYSSQDLIGEFQNWYKLIRGHAHTGTHSQGDTLARGHAHAGTCSHGDMLTRGHTHRLTHCWLSRHYCRPSAEHSVVNRNNLSHKVMC